MSDRGLGANGRSSAPPASQPTFPKRFYTTAAVAPSDSGGFALTLDARPARTPGRAPLVLPTRALADAIAKEWQDVPDVIDPRQMPLTRLANTVIDGVIRDPSAVLDEIVRFAGSDLLLYRADAPSELVHSQAAAWDPIVAWVGAEYGAPLEPVQGVMFKAQPVESLDRLAVVIGHAVGDDAGMPFRTAAFHVMTTLTGSALLALALSRNRINSDEAWNAAHVDEDHQIALWGEDAEATERRSARRREFDAAVSLLRLSS